jgi:MoaA/NifB/PqqE/SkfB family radical SAM enzyme
MSPAEKGWGREMQTAVATGDRFDFVAKLSRFPDRVQAVLDRRLSDAISTIYLDVNTDICNHACSFCDGYYRALSAAELPWTRLKLLVNEMSELGVMALVIAGDRGEPLLHSRFESFLDELTRTAIRFGIYTNGTHVPDSYVEPLSRAAFLRISVDAARPETHRRMHSYPASRHDFDDVLRNVKRLSGVSDIGVSFILDAGNLEEIDEAADIFLTQGARFIEYKPKYLPGYGVDAGWLLSEAELIRRKLNRAVQRWGDRVVLNAQIPRLLEGENCPTLVVPPRLCRTSLLRLVISTHGCYTCTPYRGEAERRVGDIMEQSLREVVESAARRALDHRTCSRCCAYHHQNEYLLRLETGSERIAGGHALIEEQDYFV